MRYILEAFLALILLIVTLPLFVFIIIVIIISSPGNPFFRHQRVGINGKLFTMIKFRTMKIKAEKSINLTVKGDARITGLGKVLRYFKIDELPQLLNIISGKMTFVGARPESPEFVKTYNEKQREILKYKPGITDPASLKYRNEEEFLASFNDPIKAYKENILPDKIKISLEYQKNRTNVSDLKIVFKTFMIIFKKQE